MKILKKTIIILWAVSLAVLVQAQEVNFVPGELLIRMKASAKSQKNSLKNQMQANTIKAFPSLDIELWKVNAANGKQATLELIEQYKNHPDVAFVEPNYLWEAIGGTKPNDPYFPQLWGLHNTGQNGGTEDADIDAPEAYCIPISAIDVVVGIVDTGIDYTHEDLAENMWQNLGEDANGNGKVLIKSGNTWIFDPGDENGIDDDGNGYADDFVGWDFAYNDNDPMDLRGHGTHCSGTTPNFAANIANSNNTFVYDFFVEDKGNTVTAHGVSASIFFGALNVVNAAIDVNSSSLNPQEYVKRFDAESNTLHFSLTKTNGSNTTLNGAVCKIVVGILEMDNGESYALNIKSGGIMQANGTMQKVGSTTVYEVYYENGVSANTLALNASASHANCENGGSALVNAFGGNGNYCYDWNTGETTQQISDLGPGIYSVLVCDDNGVSNSIEVEVQGQFIPVYDPQGNPLPCNNFITCPTIINFEGYVPNGSHQASRAIQTKAKLNNGDNVELKAGDLIQLDSGFSTRRSQSFKVRMEDCE